LLLAACFWPLAYNTMGGRQARHYDTDKNCVCGAGFIPVCSNNLQCNLIEMSVDRPAASGQQPVAKFV
jgi:hypothetical protein